MYCNNGIKKRGGWQGIIHYQIINPHQYDGTEPNQKLNVFCKVIESRHLRLVKNQK
jgi:hypothetical protein